MLRLPSFKYRPAASVAEAADVLAGEGRNARLVAGGTDLWPNMKRRHQSAGTVVGLTSVPELKGISNGGGEVRIGATATLAEVAADARLAARFPAFVHAVREISSPPLRNLGTLGGNLCLDTRCTYYNQTEHWRRSIDYCMKAAGEVCWVAPSSPRCWAHAASDSAPILCALGARVRLVSKDGERVVPLADLYRDDGIDYLTKRHEEVLTDVLVPAGSERSRCGQAFKKLRRRGSIDFAVLSAAAAVRTDGGGRVEQASLWLGAVASAPVEVDVAGMLVGERLDEERIAEASKLARKAATPMDNTDFQTQWRGQMAEVYAASVLREAAGLA